MTTLTLGAIVFQGFEVPDSHDFFTRVDRILRRSLGVNEHAPTDDSVRPAPPVAPAPPTDEELEFDDTHVPLDPEMLGLHVGEPAAAEAVEQGEWKDWKDFKAERHDEL